MNSIPVSKFQKATKMHKCWFTFLICIIHDFKLWFYIYWNLIAKWCFITKALFFYHYIFDILSFCIIMNVGLKSRRLKKKKMKSVKSFFYWILKNTTFVLRSLKSLPTCRLLPPSYLLEQQKKLVNTFFQFSFCFFMYFFIAVNDIWFLPQYFLNGLTLYFTVLIVQQKNETFGYWLGKFVRLFLFLLPLTLFSK